VISSTPFLPLTGDARDAVIDRDRLRGSRNQSARRQSRMMTGKVRELWQVIARAGDTGLTMREMGALSTEHPGINCWTQPFKTLREWGIIQTTDRRRGGGVVHVLKQTIKVDVDGNWE